MTRDQRAHSHPVEWPLTCPESSLRMLQACSMLATAIQACMLHSHAQCGIPSPENQATRQIALECFGGVQDHVSVADLLVPTTCRRHLGCLFSSRRKLSKTSASLQIWVCFKGIPEVAKLPFGLKPPKARVPLEGSTISAPQRSRGNFLARPGNAARRTVPPCRDQSVCAVTICGKVGKPGSRLETLGGGGCHCGGVVMF